MVNLQREEWVL